MPIDRLNQFLNSYKNFEDSLKSYPLSSELMCQEYLKLFKDSILNRKTLLLLKQLTMMV